jgi:hypothetical protein
MPAHCRRASDLKVSTRRCGNVRSSSGGVRSVPRRAVPPHAAVPRRVVRRPQVPARGVGAHKSECAAAVAAARAAAEGAGGGGGGGGTGGLSLAVLRAIASAVAMLARKPMDQASCGAYRLIPTAEDFKTENNRQLMIE